MAELKITRENFENEVMKSNIPVLIDFWAPWCGPCRMMGPIIEQLAEEYEGKAKVGKVNVDEEGELSQAFGVMSIPTIVLVKDGKVVKQAVGARPKAEVEAMLQ
ncbi:MAG: thioredoxin [Lachnospiraceae bacterium]|jgi:thioredoxin 1|nr:thioredoxin [Lachnospiraceae bacterium]MCI6242030.1 thioredoxin [Agathobacter sp.]MDD6658380.1 thioredoxin [Lachnospiraceae bacterium]